MCVICLSKAGVRQPNRKEIETMWEANPHGAGYMFVKDGRVEIHKGFMELNDFIRSVNEEKFTDDDVVVYHFRISTQGGVNPEMTHPFPLSDDLEDMGLLDLACDVGIVHNGIIRLTSCKSEYSDTALFIAGYLPALIRDPHDITSKDVLRCIKGLAQSKLVLLNGDGEIGVVGDFLADKSGLMFSNNSFKPKQDFYRSWSLSDLYGYKKSQKAM